MSKFCADACDSLGAWGELVAIGLIGARAVWSEVKRRQVSAKNAELKQQLSLKPAPLPPVVLQVAAVPLPPALAEPDPFPPPAEPAIGPSNETPVSTPES